MEPVIELCQVTKDYGPAMRALNNVSLTVHRGEIFGYVGANGAGKTTTIKILTGLIRPTFGEARICGRSMARFPLHGKAKIGYVPESGALYEKLSPREFLTSVGMLYLLPEKTVSRLVEQWLDYFSILDRIDQRMETFSKGTKQKVCWIAAMLHDPQVFILDEPLNGLDVEAISRAKELMNYLAAQGKTVFYSSHIIDVVEKICTRIAVLSRGQIQAVGTPEEICAATGSASLEQALMAMWQG
ncbi:MAG: ABC transporter ATP-binding protein [Blastocatellia bacterium]|nr:ABC transporter ATP-binding protein [Blastocatellia bacterium]